MTEIGKRTKDLTGQRFGKLLVQGPAGLEGGRKAAWKCLCDCGAEISVRGDTLQTRTQSCGGPVCRHSAHQDYPNPGDRFGMLTAVAFSHTNKKGGGLYWNFVCDCGNTVNTRWFQVKNSIIDHCGCQSLRKMVEGHVKDRDRNLNPFYDLLQGYKNNAHSRNLPFDLTDDQFLKLVTSNCFFCGEEPTNRKKARKRQFLEMPEDFRHNGVDRWYSHRGYTTENCVPCCKTCNYAKRSMSGENFIKWLLRATAYVQVSESAWADRKRAVEEDLRLLSQDQTKTS